MATVTLPETKVIDVIPPGDLAHLGILQAVPVIQVRWSDERETCRTVQDFLAGEIEGTFEEYSRCTGYVAGQCSGTGGASLPCLFHEPSTSRSWKRAQEWERIKLEDGTTALRRRK